MTAFPELEGVELAGDARLGDPARGGELLDAVLDRARAGLAAGMLGTAAPSFDVAFDDRKHRVQFGQVIGSA